MDVGVVPAKEYHGNDGHDYHPQEHTFKCRHRVHSPFQGHLWLLKNLARKYNLRHDLRFHIWSHFDTSVIGPRGCCENVQKHTAISPEMTNGAQMDFEDLEFWDIEQKSAYCSCIFEEVALEGSIRDLRR
jgi:hypothetical protein